MMHSLVNFTFWGSIPHKVLRQERESWQAWKKKKNIRKCVWNFSKLLADLSHCYYVGSTRCYRCNLSKIALHNLLCSSPDKSVCFPPGLVDSESSDGDIVYDSWWNSPGESMNPIQRWRRGHKVTPQVQKQWWRSGVYIVNLFLS